MKAQDARKRVAADLRENAHAIRKEDANAAHVTEAEKDADLASRLQWANEVEQGQHDGNFSVWQRMREYTHGDCPPFLP